LRRNTRITSIFVLLAVAVGSLGLTGAFGSAASSLTAAINATKQSEKGTSKLPDSTKRPAAKGKPKVFIISAGQASESSKIPSDGALAAAKAAGWDATILDGKLTVSTYGPLVRQAVQQGAKGIIVDAVDCKDAVAPLQQAKAAHIPVVPIYAFDCNDPQGGNGGKPLFAGCVNYNNIPCNKLPAFTQSYGAAQANYVVAQTKNKAKVLVINDPEFTVLKWTAKGFKDQIKKSGGSKVVATVDFSLAQLGKLEQIVSTALVAHPDVDWVKSPYSFATVAGIAKAVRAHPGVKLMGGEGFPSERPSVDAANYIDSAWTGWAAVDALNSLLTKKKSYPSGIGWTIIDKTHTKTFTPPYIPAFKKAWGK
jgi:ribose transport system substrate-binding protein